MIRRHPSRKRLEYWLEHGDDSLDPHIETCDRCSSRIEDLDSDVPALRAALQRVLSTPDDLDTRLYGGIAAKVRAQDDLRLAADLMGLPVRTVQVLAPPQPSDG